MISIGKQNFTWRSHIKYANNMDSKASIDYLDGNFSKNRLFKKMTLKMDFGCESYAVEKKA